MHIFGKLIHIVGNLLHIFAWKLVSRTSKQVSRILGSLWQPGVYNDTNLYHKSAILHLSASAVNRLCNVQTSWCGWDTLGGCGSPYVGSGLVLALARESEIRDMEAQYPPQIGINLAYLCSCVLVMTQPLSDPLHSRYLLFFLLAEREPEAGGKGSLLLRIQETRGGGWYPKRWEGGGHRGLGGRLWEEGEEAKYLFQGPNFPHQVLAYMNNSGSKSGVSEPGLGHDSKSLANRIAQSETYL